MLCPDRATPTKRGQHSCTREDTYKETGLRNGRTREADLSARIEVGKER